MGLGLTLQKFLWHLFSEPTDALQGLTHSIKDITEILYFYFTELSLTACYVILFILVARYMLRNAPKRYSYALWGVVYFKLVSVLKLDFFRHSLIPQSQIDKMYYSMTPNYTAFYSTEAGIVSQVQSEFVTLVPVVTPIYTPALIWSVVLCVLLLGSLFMYFSVYVKLRNSNRENIGVNVYLSNAISTPFVLGIIRPKIYLPKGLSEQHHNYVVTHEKVHIKRGDHIIKLFAFVITCIHWFNPLVWLSFFLLEKDMEMSCDEKVLQILGNEHKKDYSYCILSLAIGRKFMPKAYLSFGDSDTQKRIKNVLNYKKPAVIATVMTIIGVVVVAIGMLADSGVVYVPNADMNSYMNTSWVKPIKDAAPTEIECKFASPIKAYAIFEDIYENGNLISSEMIIFDNFQDEGGASPRKMSISLHPQPILGENSSFRGEFSLTYEGTGTAHLTRKLPKDHYTGSGYFANNIGNALFKKQKIKNNDSIDLLTVIYSTDPKGGIGIVEGNNVVQHNDTVVIYRLVTSENDVY